MPFRMQTENGWALCAYWNVLQALKERFQALIYPMGYNQLRGVWSRYSVWWKNFLDEISELVDFL